MSFETYEASHITPQYTLLEKLNAILGYLKSGKLTARFYMYEGLYDADKTEYDKRYAIGLDEDAGVGDILVFQNRYLAVIDHLTENKIVIQDATDIVTSVGHNYKHRVRLLVYNGGTYCKSFYITVISSTSQLITSNSSISFKDNASYLAQPYYDAGTFQYDIITINGNQYFPLFITRGKIASAPPNAGFIFLANKENGKIECMPYAWTNAQGSEYNYITLRIAPLGDYVQEI